jgi:hypothetical protein
MFRRLRGSRIHNIRQTPGFTRGHNNDTPSELHFIHNITLYKK